MKPLTYLSVWLVGALWLAQAVSAQDPAPAGWPAEGAPAEAQELAAPETLHTIGGMPEGPLQYEYTSPLKKFGIALGLGSYAISAAAGLVYLIYVYPIQALFGNSRVETVMPWLLLPIIGPWMAQYEDSVKDSPVWRGVLIGDAALQATGLLVGLLGAALSGTREREPEEHSDLEVRWGLTGLTVTWHTL
jgi:hypothetical protein